MVNYALISMGARAYASSEAPGHPARSVLRGSNSSEEWDVGGGWQDGDEGVFPDWIVVEFPEPRPIRYVYVYPLDSQNYPAARYGIGECSLQYSVDRDERWEYVGRAVWRAGMKGPMAFRIPSDVKISRIRITVMRSNDFEVQPVGGMGDPLRGMYVRLRGHSRIVAIEAWGPPADDASRR